MPVPPPGSSPAHFSNLPPPTNATPAQLREYERGRWNHFLVDEAWRRTRFNAQPNALLTETIAGLTPGQALDVNMGEGRNALYLAQQGWQVTGVDFADQALLYAQQRARELGVLLRTHAQELAAFDWGTNAWDLVVLCYADDEAHVAEVHAALKPGGLLVFENFHAEVNAAWNTSPTKQIGFDTNYLPQQYAANGFRIVRYEEPVGPADFTRETRRLVKLVAQKR
ncbi:class I SAM-dependent methyltransferase [Hymenobacter lutimineralis]|uniref:Class I SAM-dependent methyltransferase n=1 Tax=Hymenobacter lutimineralis TaxID=2606448 RepID=A0A5D6VG36_9BACT|nr:class I SAM-dependent methyltransferase [Hymenobacter lutimineralis]TYZ14375.1 class I SAM-dependent methyltransferase [Hymenobacter lutimineralis]